MHRQESGSFSPVRDASTKPWFLASVIATLILAGLLVWYLAFSFQFINSFRTQELAVERASWKLLYYDETLNMATRVSTLSGNLKWRTTYSEVKPRLQELLDEIPEMIDTPEIRRKVEKLRGYDANLTRLEERAFGLVSRGEKEKAENILAGWDYTKNRMRFETLAKDLANLVQDRIKRKASFQKRLAIAILAVIAACLLALGIFWTMTVRFWRRQLVSKKEAEEALQESEDKYKSLVQTSPDAIALADRRGRLLAANPAMEERFPSMGRGLEGSTYYSLMEEEAAKQCVELGQKAIAENRIIHQEDVRGDNSYEEYYIPVRTSSGESLFQVISKDVTEKKEMERRLREMSYHDSLTGLYNRNFFEAEMMRLSDGRYSPVGVIISDLDGLKYINDSLGHQSGDEVLFQTAEILRSTFRSSDIIARIG
ncbi:MAG: diguanylate cyclase, partial [Desulfohalobiaceae bacterium]